MKLDSIASVVPNLVQFSSRSLMQYPTPTKRGKLVLSRRSGQVVYDEL